MNRASSLYGRLPTMGVPFEFCFCPKFWSHWIVTHIYSFCTAQIMCFIFYSHLDCWCVLHKTCHVSGESHVPALWHIVLLRCNIFFATALPVCTLDIEGKATLFFSWAKNTTPYLASDFFWTVGNPMLGKVLLIKTKSASDILFAVWVVLQPLVWLWPSCLVGRFQPPHSDGAFCCVNVCVCECVHSGMHECVPERSEEEEECIHPLSTEKCIWHKEYIVIHIILCCTIVASCAHKAWEYAPTIAFVRGMR